MSVGAIESKFYAQLVKGLGLDEQLLHRQHDRAHWPKARAAIGEVFATQPREHWATLFAGTDACAYPVLELGEIPDDPHVAARGSVTVGPAGATGAVSVAPAPRLSETPGAAGETVAVTRAAQLAVLSARGVDTADVEKYQASGALHLAP
jgi:alpha-methylacyl-CoA racemase